MLKFMSVIITDNHFSSIFLLGNHSITFIIGYRQNMLFSFTWTLITLPNTIPKFLATSVLDELNPFTLLCYQARWFTLWVVDLSRFLHVFQLRGSQCIYNLAYEDEGYLQASNKDRMLMSCWCPSRTPKCEDTKVLNLSGPRVLIKGPSSYPTTRWSPRSCTLYVGDFEIILGFDSRTTRNTITPFPNTCVPNNLDNRRVPIFETTTLFSLAYKLHLKVEFLKVTLH